MKSFYLDLYKETKEIIAFDVTRAETDISFFPEYSYGPFAVEVDSMQQVYELAAKEKLSMILNQVCGDTVYTISDGKVTANKLPNEIIIVVDLTRVERKLNIHGVDKMKARILNAFANKLNYPVVFKYVYDKSKLEVKESVYDLIVESCSLRDPNMYLVRHGDIAESGKYSDYFGTIRFDPDKDFVKSE